MGARTSFGLDFGDWAIIIGFCFVFLAGILFGLYMWNLDNRCNPIKPDYYNHSFSYKYEEHSNTCWLSPRSGSYRVIPCNQKVIQSAKYQRCKHDN